MMCQTEEMFRFIKASHQVKITDNPWTIVDWVTVYCTDITKEPDRTIYKTDWNHLKEYKDSFFATRSNLDNLKPWLINFQKHFTVSN